LKLTLVSRAYCHLCDEMHEGLLPLVAGRDIDVNVVDVDADGALAEAYGERVPVLLLGVPGAGIELCHYHLDPPRVLHALDAVGCMAR
jgi:hypothetical protein